MSNSLMPEVLAIGGGTGLPIVLRALRHLHVSHAGAVCMTDNGGSTGELRERFNTPPVGDLRRALGALASNTTLATQFEERLPSENGKVRHAYGNLYLMDLFRDCENNFSRMVEVAHSHLGVGGEIIPVTLECAHLIAQLEDGSTIFGETMIDIPVHDGRKRICRLYLDRHTPANPRFLQAISEASIIILGPGDFYTSLVACLLPEGVTEELRRSKAKKFFLLNTMSKYGETWNFGLSNFMNELVRYIGADVFDIIIANNNTPSIRVQEYYAAQNAKPISVESDDPFLDRVIFRPLLAEGKLAHHDPLLLRDVLREFLNTNVVKEFIPQHAFM